VTSLFLHYMPPSLTKCPPLKTGSVMATDVSSGHAMAHGWGSTRLLRE
jgi:hypothetical protein